MPRLPAGYDFGPRPDGAVSRPVVGANTARAYEAGEQEAVMGARAAGKVTEAADRLTLAEMRITNQREAVERARALGAYNEMANTELRRLQTEGDFSKLETTKAYGKFLSDKKAELLGAHGGSDSSRLALEERMEGVRHSQIGNAATLATQAQRTLLTKTFGDNLSRLTAAAAANPGKIAGLYKSLDADIDDMAPALTPEQEMEFRSIGRKEIALSALNDFVSRGNAKEARKVLDETPGLQEFIGPDAQRQLSSRLIAIETREDEMRNAGLRKLSEAEQIVGAKLTTAQRLRLAGLGEGKTEETPAAKIAALETALGPLSPEQKAKALGVYIEQKGVDLSSVAGMRKEFTNQSGDFIKVRDAYNKISATASNPSPAGDMALIFNYMKMLDPGSTVREGEYATAQNAGSVPDRVWAQYNKAVAGESLAPPQRTDFLKQSKNLYDSQLKTQKQLETIYKGHATRAGFNPEDVVSDLAGEGPGSVSGPAEAPVIQYNLGGQRVGAVKK